AISAKGENPSPAHGSGPDRHAITLGEELWVIDSNALSCGKASFEALRMRTGLEVARLYSNSVPSHQSHWPRKNRRGVGESVGRGWMRGGGGVEASWRAGLESKGSLQREGAGVRGGGGAKIQRSDGNLQRKLHGVPLRLSE
ncbi:hypothetical protein BaRGS_00004747, partial [Batillaria attramentaria]